MSALNLFKRSTAPATHAEKHNAAVTQAAAALSVFSTVVDDLSEAADQLSAVADEAVTEADRLYTLADDADNAAIEYRRAAQNINGLVGSLA